MLFRSVVDRLPFAFRKLQVVGRSARFRDEAERLAAWFAGFVGDERRRLLGPQLAPHAAAGVEPFAAALADTSARMPLDRMLDADLRIWLTDDLLMKMDKMSMAASIEARVPFLDVPFIDWAMRVGHEHKIRGLEGKVLLKRLARTLLPVEVVDRPKVGFTVPLSPWFRGELRELLGDTLLSSRCLQRGWFEADAVRAALDEAPVLRASARFLGASMADRAHIEAVADHQDAWSQLLPWLLWDVDLDGLGPVEVERDVALPGVLLGEVRRGDHHARAAVGDRCRRASDGRTRAGARTGGHGAPHVGLPPRGADGPFVAR